MELGAPAAFEDLMRMLTMLIGVIAVAATSVWA